MRPGPDRPKFLAVMWFAVLLTAGAAAGDAPAQPPSAAPPGKPAEAAAPETTPPKPKVPKVGEKSPDARVHTAEGKEIALSSVWADGPVVVVFYRGGWCPVCRKALAAWRERAADLTSAGARLVVITPEAREHMVKTREAVKGDYLALCDHEMNAARAFGVLFRLDGETQEKYRGYGIDLAKHNQCRQWDLPAPGTFVIDRAGVVRFAHAEWDYSKRAEPAEVIKALGAFKAAPVGTEPSDAPAPPTAPTSPSPGTPGGT